MLSWLLRLFRAQPQQMRVPPPCVPLASRRDARPSFPRRLTSSQLRAYMRQRRAARDAAPTATALEDLPAAAAFDDGAFRQLVESDAQAWAGAGGESGGAGASGSWDPPTDCSDNPDSSSCCSTD